jgi:hypothetical protein
MGGYRMGSMSLKVATSPRISAIAFVVYSVILVL